MTGAHGIDTVRFRFYSPGVKELLRSLAGRWRPLPRGDLLALRICGGSVVVVDSAHFDVEARLALLLGDDRSGSPLASADRLIEAARRVCGELAALDVQVDRPLVTRLDLAAELVFEDGLDGLAFLAACGNALNLPRTEPVTRPGTDRLGRSVVWETAELGEVARLYDAGRWHGTHHAGDRVRLEVQERWGGAGARTLEQVVSLDLAALYERRLKQFVGVRKRVIVATPSAARREVLRRMHCGDLSRKKATTLVAQIAKLECPGLIEPHERNRLVRQVRDDGGVALDLLGVGEATSVDIAGPLTELVGAWREKQA